MTPTTPSSPSDFDDRFFRILVNNTSEGLITINEQSQILYANPAIKDILGYVPAELIGSSKLEIIPDRLKAVHERQLRAYIESGEKHIDWNGVELPALHKDGHEVPVTISLREHTYNNQRLFTGLFRDTSDLKAKEETLREQNERLETFAQVVSHDLRNPLNIAQGYTSMPASDVGETELARIADALERMEGLLDKMLELTTAGEGGSNTGNVSIGEAARESWQWVNTAGATLEVIDDCGTVQADQRRIESLFENIFRNAVEHGSESATVRVGPLSHDPGFFIEDDGPGIPPEERDRIFETGYSTQSKGSGLGLSIVREVVDEHGWSVTLTSGADGGARFEFRTERESE